MRRELRQRGGTECRTSSARNADRASRRRARCRNIPSACTGSGRRAASRSSVTRRASEAANNVLQPGPRPAARTGPPAFFYAGIRRPLARDRHGVRVGSTVRLGSAATVAPSSVQARARRSWAPRSEYVSALRSVPPFGARVWARWRAVRSERDRGEHREDGRPALGGRPLTRRTRRRRQVRLGWRSELLGLVGVYRAWPVVHVRRVRTRRAERRVARPLF